MSLSAEEQDRQRRLISDKTSVLKLQQSSEFQAFLRVIAAKRDEAALRVLNEDSLTPDSRETQRQIYKAFRDIPSLLVHDEVATEHALGSLRDFDHITEVAEHLDS